MNNDPLGELLVDADEVDRTLLARLLKDFVLVDKKSQRFVFQPAFARLDAKGKIVKYLLAIKARSLLLAAEDGAAAKEIINAIGVASGTVHPSLRDLLEQRTIGQNPNRKYFIPGWTLAGMSEAPDVKR